MLRFIGQIRTPWTDRADCPRQGRTDGPDCRLVLDEIWAPALQGISKYDRIEVLYWLDRSRRDLLTQSPRSDGRTVGTFALRSPVRPNPIGTSRVRLVRVNGTELVVRGLDCLDRTPLIDIKPDRCEFTPKAPPKAADGPDTDPKDSPMPAPINTLKQRFRAGDTTFGSWLSFAEASTTEVMGTVGFDWLVIDSEHAPNDIRSIRNQLMALQTSPSSVVVRVPTGEPWIIKQVLDVGAQTILVPMVESGEQARQMVRACTYPPEGIRGVGATSTRSSRFSTITDYTETANEQISLIVQVESRAGLAALDDILAVEGIDCVFIGPADLAADLGHAGNMTHPDVHATIIQTLGRIAASGKVPGILCLSEEVTESYLEAGARFIAVAIDVITLAKAARATAARWISPAGS